MQSATEKDRVCHFLLLPPSARDNGCEGRERTVSKANCEDSGHVDFRQDIALFQDEEVGKQPQFSGRTKVKVCIYLSFQRQIQKSGRCPTSQPPELFLCGRDAAHASPACPGTRVPVKLFPVGRKVFPLVAGQGPLAQLVERHVYTVNVIGSIPVGPTTQNPLSLASTGWWQRVFVSIV